MSSSKKSLTVCVEGNIGSGKTTLLKHFAKFSEVEIISEPVEKWRNVNGHNLLDLMYTDPRRWSCMFQSYVQLTMLESHVKPCSVAVKMMERSIHSGRFCFIENLYQSELMSAAEYTVLDQWYRYITSTCSVQPDLIVYLRSTPEVVYERVLARSRDEERTLPLSYLQALHRLHEQWLLESATDVPVLVLDANKDMNTLKEELDSRRHEILCNQLVRSALKNADIQSARASV